jgi:hypothetical protein
VAVPSNIHHARPDRSTTHHAGRREGKLKARPGLTVPFVDFLHSHHCQHY